MFTTRDKLACLQREIRLREQVYPGRVERSRMTQFSADREIALMRAIESDYQARLKAEEQGLFLFHD